MQIKAFLVVVFLISYSFSNVNAQGGDKDLLEKCYIDSRSGDTIRETKWTLVGSASDYLLNFRMTRINSKFTLDLSYHFGAKEKFLVPKGDSVWVKFIGGAKITLFAQDSTRSYKGGAMIPGSLKGAVTPGVSVKYQMFPYQAYIFLANEVEKVRIFCSTGFKDVYWFKDNELNTNPELSYSIQAAKLVLEKRKKYKVCEPDPEPKSVTPIEEGAKDDDF